MNSNNTGRIETVINVKEIIWDLLEQWKAVLITALLVMALVAGAKYAKDMKSYEAAQAEKEAQKQSTASAEDQIRDVLEALPESERSTVMTIVNQNEWIEKEKEYINKSILLNTDPTNQRTLAADYYIAAAEDTDSVRDSLIFGYRSYLKDKEVAEALGKVIAPGAETKYITELISAENSGSSDEAASADAILEIQVVLPDGADPQKVEETLTTLLKEQSPEMSSRICPHRIELISAGETYLYNSGAVNNRTNILYSINNLQNNTKNMQTSLSDGQKAAIESISAVRAAEKTATTVGPEKTDAKDAEDSKPRISKKYALLGFVLGAMMYAFIYLLTVIFKGRITNAGDAEYYTQSRLLGEVYTKEEHKGIGALLHSAFVDKIRYKGRLDEEEQIRRLASALEVVCKHEGIDKVSVLGFSEMDETGGKVIKAINDKGIKTAVTDISKEEDGSYLLDIRDAVFMTDRSCKAEDLMKIGSMLDDCEVSRTGSIYMGEI